MLHTPNKITKIIGEYKIALKYCFVKLFSILFVTNAAQAQKMHPNTVSHSINFVITIILSKVLT